LKKGACASGKKIGGKVFNRLGFGQKVLMALQVLLLQSPLEYLA